MVLSLVHMQNKMDPYRFLELRQKGLNFKSAYLEMELMLIQNQLKLPSRDISRF